jgi:hypothetical protein
MAPAASPPPVVRARNETEVTNTLLGVKHTVDRGGTGQGYAGA